MFEGLLNINFSHIFVEYFNQLKGYTFHWFYIGFLMNINFELGNEVITSYLFGCFFLLLYCLPVLVVLSDHFVRSIMNNVLHSNEPCVLVYTIVNEIRILLGNFPEIFRLVLNFTIKCNTMKT